MITAATIAAIVACVDTGAQRHAIDLVEIACDGAALSSVPRAPREIPREKRAIRALDALDDLEDLVTRRARARKLPGSQWLRCHRAILELRALVARGRPVIHDRGAYLCDDDATEKPRWWHVGARREANDNGERAADREVSR